MSKQDAEPTREPIEVAKRILIHLGAGIYSTPGNALKELISNSFDADAKEVQLDTNAPLFDRLTCSDNGIGMPAAKFKAVMKQIGESQKETQESTASGRPIIGKFGIGLLAVSPICNKFRVISSVKGSPYKFEAEVDLTQFRQSLRKRRGKQLGTYLLWDRIPENRDAHFTRIILEDLQPQFARTLKESAPSRSRAVSQGMSFERKAAKLRERARSASKRIRTFEKLVRWMATEEGNIEQNLPGRDRLIWELGLLCPVSYIDDGPVRGASILSRIGQELESFDFKVFVDSVEIHKPALFPLDSEISIAELDYASVGLSYDSDAHSDYPLDQPLKFEGYIYWQRKGIKPSSLRGVLLRMRHVGVNAYDDSCLNFPELQAIRLQQISSEIFIERGLEEAFNIDRKSFNETDPQYAFLQNYFADQLMHLFRRTYKWGRFRRDVKLAMNRDDRLLSLLRFLDEVSGDELGLEYTDLPADYPLTFDESRRVFQINLHSVWPRGKQERQTLEDVLLCLELARMQAPRNWNDKFLQLLERLVRHN